MKIEIISGGRNQLHVINLVREYSGMGLNEAKYFTDFLPASFKCNRTYKEIPEIIENFERAGCRIVIETGHRKPRKIESNLSLSKILFSMGEEDSEKQELKTREEAINFLKKRQNFKKAISSGIIASLILLVMFTIYFYKSDFDVNPHVSNWTINTIIGLILAYSIRKRGRGVEKKFGYMAAALTVLTSIALAYINYVIIIFASDLDLSYLFSFKIFSSWSFIASLSVSGLLAYFAAYEHITSSNYTDKMSKFYSGTSVSEYIDEKRSNLKAEFTAHNNGSKIIDINKDKTVSEETK